MGFRVQGSGFRVQGLTFRVEGFGLRVVYRATLTTGPLRAGGGGRHSPQPRQTGFGFWVLGFGFRVSGFGFRVSGFGLRVSGFVFRVSGFGFRVSGFGSRARGLGEGGGDGATHRSLVNPPSGPITIATPRGLWRWGAEGSHPSQQG